MFGIWSTVLWEATVDCSFMRMMNDGVWPIYFKRNGLTLTRVIKGFFFSEEGMPILLPLTFYYNAKKETETGKTNVL